MPGNFDFSKIENPEGVRRGESYGASQEKIEINKTKDYAEAEKIIETEKIKNKEIVLTPEQQAAEEGMIKCLSKGWINDAIKIKNEFSLPEEIVRQAAEEGMIKCLSKGRIDSAIAIKNEFSLPEEVIHSPEVRQAAKEGMIKYLSGGWIDNAIEIKNEFSLPEEIVRQAAKEGMIKCLSEGWINDAIGIKNKFSLPEEIVRQAAEEGMIKCLSKGWIDNAIEIKNEFSLPEEIVHSPEVRQAAKEGMIKHLSEGRIDIAIEIKNEFSVKISSKEIIDSIPALRSLLDHIKQISPEFHSQTLKSEDLVISLVQFKDNPERFIQEIQENPFLINAVAENPRFGSRLIVKFPEFDELSKQNIQTLFSAKKEILANNPDIDPESLEFRQLMQEKLKNYENNQEILAALEKEGVDADQWLNYSEVRYFNMESGGGHLAFSETVKTPLDRIKETIDSYAHILKEVLKQYHPELSVFQIPLEDAKETEDKINQMLIELEKAKTEGNEKKAQGIAKGMESLRKKMENVKTVALWDKLVGDISAFQRLKNDVFGAQEKLIQAENEMREKSAGKAPPGKTIQDLKEKIGKAKEELRSKFSVLERRIEDFKANTSGLLAPCLTKDRTDALTQEINTRLAEQFDHYDSDRRELANLFLEKSGKEKEKMENQPMSIFVWARNPDIDLYQGNYSDCCIRIDSEHMGAESTIADYNADLGVQIVNIWDETKNEPITAAWCWIGKNKKGETALVADNIESNTQYSANYPEQLSKELFDYIKNYAQAIGVKKVVLGKANNDLPTAGGLAKMKDDKNEYNKLGGYNRIDGYFLEAEEKNVKLLWEKAVDKRGLTSGADKQKLKKTAKIEFKDLNIENLTEKDFAKIKQLERKIYAGTDLAVGQAMINYILEGNGLEYSVIQTGKRKNEKENEIIGYLAAEEGETDEGAPSIYLEDIAVLPEAQGQGVGWNMLKSLVEKLKIKAGRDNKPILFDMHLRENSQRFMERHRDELEQMGVKLIEEALVPDYYGDNKDALYQVYLIK